MSAPRAARAVKLVDGPVEDPDVCGHVWCSEGAIWHCCRPSVVVCESCEDEVCWRHAFFDKAGARTVCRDCAKLGDRA